MEGCAHTLDIENNRVVTKVGKVQPVVEHCVCVRGQDVSCLGGRVMTS
jgi:hypothetical protein